MEKQIFKKIFALAVALITVVATFIPFVGAAGVENPMLTSKVMDDLNVWNINTADYPADPSADFVSVVNFLEYGYDKDGDQRYYGLYLYLYNPSLKPVKSGGHYLQMNYRDRSSAKTKEIKYPLKLISASEESGRENLFLKFKVDGSNVISQYINPVERSYLLSSLELVYEGATTVASSPLKQEWNYFGYQYNFGSDNPKGTLTCDYDVFDVISVDLNSTYWFTDTSDLGADYRYEISSVYFNIPNYYINKYGDPLDTAATGGTSGLYSVEGLYDKYYVNGLIVPDQEWYNRFEPVIGKNIQQISPVPSKSPYPSFMENNFWEYIVEFEGVSPELNAYYSYNSRFDYIQPCPYDSYNKIRMIELLSVADSADISKEDLEALIAQSSASIYDTTNSMYLNMVTPLPKLGKNMSFYVSVDGNSLNSSLKSYASRDELGSLNWLHRLFNNSLYSDESGYPECKPIVELTEVDVGLGAGSIFDPGVLADKLFVYGDDLSELKTFYSDHALNNHVYLMRFDVNPYFCSKAALYESPNWFEMDFLTRDFGYYYERVFYENFDILEFTFRDKGGSKVAVPVDCKPIDIIGGVINGNNGVDPDPNNTGDMDDSMSWLEKLIEFLKSLNDFWTLTAIVVGLIVAIVLFVVTYPYLKPVYAVIGKALIGFFNILGAAFGALFKVLGFIFGGIGLVFSFIWNIGANILYNYTGVDIRISSKPGGDTRTGSSAYKEEKRLEAAEKRAEAESAARIAESQARTEEINRRARQHKLKFERKQKSVPKEKNSENKSTSDGKPSYGDSDDFFDLAVKHANEDLKK